MSVIVVICLVSNVLILLILLSFCQMRSYVMLQAAILRNVGLCYCNILRCYDIAVCWVT